MRSRRVIVLLCLAAVMAPIAVWVADAGATSGSGQRRTLGQNQAAARADAKALLTRVNLPSGSARATLPHTKPEFFIGTTAGALNESAWTVPGDTPQQVIAFITAHMPAGSTVFSTGSTSGPNGPTELQLTFSFLDEPGIIDGRYVEVNASPASGGATKVRIEAESVWFVPRTSASLIPAGAKAITVESTDAKGATLSTHTITAGPRIAATVRFFNGLEAGQPFVINCPLELANGDALTVSFSGAGATPLAQATWQEVRDGQSGECSPVSLTVRGRSEGIVYGGDYTQSLQRLLGVTVPSGS